MVGTRANTNAGNSTTAPVDPQEPEVFIVDPCLGDINPGTKSGQLLFANATKSAEPNKRLTANIENAKKIQAYCEDLASKFGWGKLVNMVKDANSKPRSILRESKLLTIEDAQAQAMTYLCPTGATQMPDDRIIEDLDPANDNDHKKKFFLRVVSIIITKSIEGHFTNSTLTALRNSKDKYQWIDSNGHVFNDGPTMLFILMGICNPTVRVGVESLKKKIEAARLPAFNHDVSRCMDYMVTNYNLIIEQEETHDNII